MPMRRRMALMSVDRAMRSTPSIEIDPPVGSSRRLQQRSSVLLPDPEGPMMNTSSCGNTSRSIPRSTSRWPKLLRSPRTSRIGGRLEVICNDKGRSHLTPSAPQSAPSPSRTRVFPSSAVDNRSKSETSEVDTGEGWGGGRLFDSADPLPPSRRARADLPLKGGGNRSELADTSMYGPSIALGRVLGRIVALHVGDAVAREHGDGRGARLRVDAEPSLVHLGDRGVELHAFDRVLELLAQLGRILAQPAPPTP